MGIRQMTVWNDIKKAQQILKKARSLEYKIETDRVQAAIKEASQHGYYPDLGVTDHDPLGGRLDNLIEKLENILNQF